MYNTIHGDGTLQLEQSKEHYCTLWGKVMQVSQGTGLPSATCNNAHNNHTYIVYSREVDHHTQHMHVRLFNPLPQFSRLGTWCPAFVCMYVYVCVCVRLVVCLVFIFGWRVCVWWVGGGGEGG